MYFLSCRCIKTPFCSLFSDDNQTSRLEPPEPKRIKKTVPGSPEFASQAPVIASLVFLSFHVFTCLNVFSVVPSSLAN